jgi:hypothetical protein
LASIVASAMIIAVVVVSKRKRKNMTPALNMRPSQPQPPTP